MAKQRCLKVWKQGHVCMCVHMSDREREREKESESVNVCEREREREREKIEVLQNLLKLKTRFVLSGEGLKASSFDSHYRPTFKHT